MFGLGECRPPSHDWLWGLMLATVGERPLGVMAAQLDTAVRSSAVRSPDKKGVKLPRTDWTRTADGLEARRVLPDGLEFFARVTPAPRGADMELRLRNGSDRKRTALRAPV